MAVNRELYQEIDKELSVNKIEESAEDLLLELAEMLLDEEVPGRELSCQLEFDETVVKAVGRLEPDEDEPEILMVYVQSIAIGEKVFPVEDYLL